jgi:hypothetical protein
MAGDVVLVDVIATVAAGDSVATTETVDLPLVVVVVPWSNVNVRASPSRAGRNVTATLSSPHDSFETV